MTEQPTATEVQLKNAARGIDDLIFLCHGASKARGWWHDPITGLSLIPGADMNASAEQDEIITAWFPYVIATKIALIHSEVSEGLEGYRTGAMDDKIPEYAAITAEMADVLIRVFDLLGMLRDQSEPGKEAYDLPQALIDKMLVNAVRPDHNVEARRKPGGKLF